jgi:hypothetical protein
MISIGGIHFNNPFEGGKHHYLNSVRVFSKPADDLMINFQHGIASLVPAFYTIPDAASHISLPQIS